MDTEETSLPSFVTMQQAEDSLPRVKRLVEELQQLQVTIDMLDTIEMEVDEEDLHNHRNITRFNKAFHRLCYDFYRKLDQLEEKGAILKDLHKGLVDFIVEFEGRPVFLCWMLDEDKIQHWHEVDSGFDGRKRIVDLG